MRIEFAHCSDVGMERAENQDALGQATTALGELFVVCDGMGGHRGGSLASKLAVETITEYFAELPEGKSAKVALREGISRANEMVFATAASDPEIHGMGTTCVAMLVSPDGKRTWVAHVGDSRIYRVRADRIEQLTRDHTAVQDMIDRGVITPDQAAHHPSSNVINRSVGVRPRVEPEVRDKPLDNLDRDLYLLCSDGLTGMMDDEVIYRYMTDVPLGTLPKELIDLANARGGYDNVTAMVVQIGEPRVPEGPSESGMARLSDLLEETQRQRAWQESSLSPREAPEVTMGGVPGREVEGRAGTVMVVLVAVLTVLAITVALVAP